MKFQIGDLVLLDGEEHRIVDDHPPTNHYRLRNLWGDDMGWAPGYELSYAKHPLVFLAEQAE